LYHFTETRGERLADLGKAKAGYIALQMSTGIYTVEIFVLLTAQMPLIL